MISPLTELEQQLEREAKHLTTQTPPPTTTQPTTTAKMPFLASLTDPKPYHILTYGTLLGSNLFQTFINGPLAYNALPRPSFSTLQTAIFPVYFGIQTALPVVLALTWPGERSVAGHVNSGFKGLLAEENKWTALTPIALMFVTNLANLVWLGPATTKVMKERKHQGRLDMNDDDGGTNGPS